MSKNQKDKLYDILSGPLDRQQFARLMEEQEYETDSIDFKEKWIEKGKLAKIILAMANYGGGIIVFGIKEHENHKGDPVGLSDDEMKDSADVLNGIKKYLPENISWDLQSFTFNGSEYKKMSDKNFQIIVVHDTPEHLPFISVSEGEDLKSATIYTRRQTESAVANNAELQNMIDRRIKTRYVSKIDFSTHLKQLSDLYKYKQDVGGPLQKLGFIANYQHPELSENINELIDLKLEQIKKEMGIY